MTSLPAALLATLAAAAEEEHDAILQELHALKERAEAYQSVAAGLTAYTRRAGALAQALRTACETAEPTAAKGVLNGRRLDPELKDDAA